MTGLELHIPVLTTERLRLRAPRMSDFDMLAAFLATGRSHFVGGPVTEVRQVRRILGMLAGQWVLRGFGVYILETRETGATIGLSGLWYPQGWPEPELSWSIWDAAHEGKGLAFEAAHATRNDAFGRIGLPTAVSYIDPDNARSIALAERLGAVRDDRAATPDGETCLVYRHDPEAA